MSYIPGKMRKITHLAALLVLNFLFNPHLASAAHTGPSLKAVTFNVFAGAREMNFERLARQIEEVRALDADIIALQETFDRRVKAAYRNAFPDYYIFESGEVPVPTRWSYRALNWSHKALELVTKVTGLARWSQGSRHMFDGDTYGLMILVKKDKGTVQLDTQHVERFDVQAGRGILKLLEAVKPKGFLWIEYVVDGIPLLVVNSHLSNGVENYRRAGQLAQLAESLEARTNANAGIQQPVLFLVDANANGSEPEMQWLHDGKFVDTYLVAHPDLRSVPGEGITWDDANPLAQTGNLREPPQRVDYISVIHGDHHHFEVMSSDVMLNTQGNFVSDHNAVVTQVELKNICSDLLEASNR